MSVFTFDDNWNTKKHTLERLKGLLDQDKGQLFTPGERFAIRRAIKAVKATPEAKLRIKRHHAD